MRTISFKVDEDLLKKIDLLAKLNNMERSHLIRLALKRIIDPNLRIKLKYPISFSLNDFNEKDLIEIEV
ncbi:MAG: hypothetical protein DRP01_06985 [Archaeoglobales archaeon]|nr:MAG: hypothetical protein DRP01_06985 [Archaeoglobales archaeon]